MRRAVRVWMIGLLAGLATWVWAQEPGADVTPPTFVLEGTVAEAGQLIEGAGSASFSWMKQPGVKFGVAFAAPRTGTITNVTLQWKCSTGYGEGNYGTYIFALQTDGPGHFATGVGLGVRNNVKPSASMGGRLDGALSVPLKATVTAGTIYHLVMKNVDPDPTRNYSSPNTLMTRVTPWDGIGYDCAVYETGAKWRPWSSINNLFNTAGTNYVNGSHCPVMLTWADGANTGDPYYSSLVRSGAYLWGAQSVGQYIQWDQPTTDVCGIGLSVGRMGTPGTLRYHISDADGVELAGGVLATSGPGELIPQWLHMDLPAPVTFETGKAYRLWFDSPDSPGPEDCFYQYIPYGEATPAPWLECGWGGTASHYCTSGNGGAAWTARPAFDLTFSLRLGRPPFRTAITLEQTSPAGASLILPAPPVVDDTDPNPVVSSDAQATLPPGVTTVTWTARDASGNAATLAVQVTVADTTPPTLVAPPNLSVALVEGNSATVALGTPTVSDAADPSPTVTHTAPASFPLGTTTVTWTAVDAAGNRTTAVQRVTVARGFAITGIEPTSFRPTAREKVRINYRMPARSACRIVVRTALGALVSTLATDDAGSDADTGRTTWDGRDARSRYVAAGVYTITVESTKADGLLPATATVTVR